MTTDDKPSIAELQRLERDSHHDGLVISVILNAAPVLLEIAATALARDMAVREYEAWNGDMKEFDRLRHAAIAARDVHRAALAKVRP